MPEDQQEASPLSPEELERLEQLKGTPVYEKALKLIRNFSEYTDFSSNFLHNFPKNLPQNFSLKLGPVVVGSVSIEWKMVFAWLFVLAATGTKPEDRTEEEHAELIKFALAHQEPEERAKMLYPYYSILWYMAEYTPQKLNDALSKLLAEARLKIVIDHRKKHGSTPMPAIKEFTEWLAKEERKAASKRLPEVRGGTRKTKPAWKDQAMLRRYAELVTERRILCQCIKDMYDLCEGDDSWVEDLKSSSNYQRLSVTVPSAILTWAIKRAATDTLPKREREPLAIACEMARQELQLPKQKVETLRNYYGDGNKLLKQDRREAKE